MIINVINLSKEQPGVSLNPEYTSDFIIKSRENRVLSVCNQSKLYGLNVRFWEGEIFRGNFIDGRIGISRAFKRVVKWAKENRLPEVCIAEDDFLMSGFGAWEYYLENIPVDYDIYLGGIYDGQISEGRIVKGYAGHTLITVHSRFFDFFLSADENLHIDRWLGQYCSEKKYMVCVPYVVSQISTSYSDNHKAMASHAPLIEGVKLYGQ
jgi:hypothetical protein